MSLTAVADRLDTLANVLRRLFDQSRPPDRVFLWLSEDGFLLDRGVKPRDLPAEIRELERTQPLEVRFVPNTGPHRKLLPLLRELQGQADPPLIVTADDDILYPHRWLETLCAAYRPGGPAVCFRARRMLSGPAGLLPYTEWPLLPSEEEVQGPDVFATGNCGFLCHPSMFDPRILTLRQEAVCATRSDVWQAGALLARGVEVLKLSTTHLFPDPAGVSPNPRGYFPPPLASRSHPLYLYNRTREDVQIARSFAFFGGHSLRLSPPPPIRLSDSWVQEQPPSARRVLSALSPRLRGRWPRRLPLPRSVGARTIWARSCDLGALRTVYQGLEYLPVIERLPPRPRVLDGGAHVGAFALSVFDSRPHAQVCSMEANRATARVLRLNRRSCAQEAGRWVVRPRVGMEQALRELSWDRVDLLKLSVGGAEEQLLSDAGGLLERIHMLVFQIHPALCDVQRVMALATGRWRHVYQLGCGARERPLLLATDTRCVLEPYVA